MQEREQDDKIGTWKNEKDGRRGGRSREKNKVTEGDNEGHFRGP